MDWFNFWTGQWKDDLQDGIGIETWADGSQYEGQYKDTKKSGKGIYTWSDGSKYDGQWSDNRLEKKNSLNFLRIIHIMWIFKHSG